MAVVLAIVDLLLGRQEVAIDVRLLFTLTCNHDPVGGDAVIMGL